ncbi:MAG: 7-cyano-7-deazaguanine synthase QueC [Candidatus Cloacimonetes bacterium]|nr:7-cyano-7-deazaguanine synthase QueC [Candidatus Cloacimonadota bacterium]
MTQGIVLVSGGMDSLVTAAIAQNECDAVYYLHVNYGQKTQARELMAFEGICDHYHPADVLEADVTYLAKIGGSSLTDSALTIDDHSDKEEVPNTYVPFRNAHLIAIATSWAEVIGAQRIYIGAVEEDSSGYPDCRERFYTALERAIDEGTKDETKIQLCTPIIHKSKAEIVKLGMQLGAPLELSWSCYRNDDVACGTCDSCILRIRAFQNAGVKDPIPYAIEVKWDADSM